MSTTRERGTPALFNFGLQDFGTLLHSEVKAVPEKAAVTANSVLSHESSVAAAAPSQDHLPAPITTRTGGLENLYAPSHGNFTAHHNRTPFQANVQPDSAQAFQKNPLAPSQPTPPAMTLSHALPLQDALSVAPMQTSLLASAAAINHLLAPTNAHAGSNGIHAPPPVVAVGGQLWYGVDNAANTGLDHIDTDGAGKDVAEHDTSGADFASMAVDGADGFYFGYTRDGLLRIGHITNDVETGQASEIQEILIQHQVAGHPASNDEVNAIAVDPLNHIIFVGLWGQADQYTGILEVQYDPSTGALTSPYNASAGTVSDFGHMLFHDDNSGLVNGVTAMTNIIAMQYDMQDGNLYYVDQTNIWPGSSGSGLAWHQTNGIYRVSTTGSVSGTEPVPVQLSLNSQFAAGDNNNYIEGLAINEAQGLIYFAVNDAATTTSKLYYMPIAGGTATQMSIPGGVTFIFADDQGTGVNPLAFDPNLRQLYVSDNQGQDIVELTLSADGKSFTGGNSSFDVIDNNHDGTGPTGLFFDPLPTLGSLSATTTEALQGGSALNLLTAAPTITDPQDGASNKLHMGFAQIVVANAQSGDNLFANGAQSGTIAGTNISINWNSSTHTLTLSGNDTEAHYQTAFDLISFQDAGTDNSTGSHPTRTIDWIISDGTTIVDQTTADSNERATTVVIDRAPTVVADSYTKVLEGSVLNDNAAAGVLHNDSDKDADAIVVTALNGSAGNLNSLTFTGTYGHFDLQSDGSFVYTADLTGAIDGAANGSHPVDTFTYTVSDGIVGVSTTTVSFTIDRAPTLVADNPLTQALEGAGSTSLGNVLTNDSDKDGDPLVVSQVNGSAAGVNNSVAGTYGHITINSNGTYSYNADNTSAIDSAATGSHLTDTFTYTVDDGQGSANQVTTVTVTIDRAPTVVADAPVAEAVESGVSVTGNVLTNDSDRDGDSLTVTLINGGAVASGAGGTVFAGTYGHLTMHQDGTYSYVADNTVAIDGAATGSHLTDSFTYTASDGFGGTSPETLTFTIDRGPTVSDHGTSLAESGTVSGTGGLLGTGALGGDSDRDGDGLQVTMVNGTAINDTLSNFAGTYGHLTIGNDGSYSYTADITSAIDAAPTGSHPVEHFTLTIDDGHGGTITENLDFTIDRPAIASADSLDTTEDAQATVGSGLPINANLLANDTDPDGDSFAITAVNGSGANVGNQIVLASGALLTVNSNGTYTYDPNHAFDYLAAVGSGASDTSATDTFTYTITGGSTVTVTITVNGVDSNDVLIGTSGSDTINGGIGDDIFYDDNGLRSGEDPHDTSAGKSGGVDSFSGGSGNDFFYMGGNLIAADQIDGGTGTDHVVLNGDYTGANAVTFNATTMLNVEVLGLTAGHSYTLTMDNATVASGQTLRVQGGTLGAGDALIFDASNDTTGGNYVITAGAGNDVLTGGAGNDHFVVSAGGTDTVHGGAGDDTINAGAMLTAADAFDGGSGTDTLVLKGDYSSGVVFNATTLTNVEVIALTAGHDYNLTMNAATVASGQTLTVHAATLLAGDNVTFNAAAGVAGSSFVFDTGAGDDILTGGAGNDTFRPGAGNDTIHGGGGDDTINMGANLTAADVIDGGSGTDTILLDGDYSAGITFGATTVTNVETIYLTPGNDYTLTTNDATVAAGQTLTILAPGLGAGDKLVFDGSAETDGSFIIHAGAGNDILTGGAGADTIKAGNGNNTITGGLGGDDITGGSGNDLFVYNAVAESTSITRDRVHGFDAIQDQFQFTGVTVNAIDTAITTGHLSIGTFDANLAAAVNSGNLAAHDAVLFTADSGNLSGHTFLVVDANGVAGYQASQDFVIDITGATNLASLTTGNFLH